MTIHLPGASRPLTITSTGAATKPYVKSLAIDGKPISGDRPVITHAQMKDGADVVFEMSAVPQAWGSATLGNVSANEEKAGAQGEQEHVEL